VAQVRGESIVVIPSAAHAESPLKPGDGVVFDAADWRSPEEKEEGGRVYQVAPSGKGRLEVRFGNGALNFARIRAGDLLWRTDDPELDRVAKAHVQAGAPVAKQPVQVHVVAHEGAPLSLTWTLANRPQFAVTVHSPEALVAAQRQGLTLDLLRDQLGRLGNSTYRLDSVTLEMEGSPFVPSSLLNQLRRQAIEQLAALQEEPRPVTVHDPAALLAAEVAHIRAGSKADRMSDGRAQLHLLVRTPEQLEAALDLHPASITLDYLELYGLRPAVEQIHAAGIVAQVASPRVLKPAEQRIVNFLLRLDCPILVRSTGLLHALLAETTHPPLLGDFSLNAANILSSRRFLDMGLERLTLTHDLNADQVAALAQAVGAGRIEAVAYHHLPVFHTEHCVFCRFLSKGTSYKDCGHPCETHKVALRDTSGRAHPVMADVGCRNTVFGAQAQEASQFLDRWRGAGIQHYRLEFAHEDGDQVQAVARVFADALAGKLTSPKLARRLAEITPQGTTAGSLFVPEGYMELPLI
jgi:putative protease